MYTLDTITTGVEFSKEMAIKIGDSTMNIIRSLAHAGRNSFTAEDIAYIINRQVKSEWNKVTAAQVERAIRHEAKHNARGEVRRGFRAITALGMGFYQYGR